MSNISITYLIDRAADLIGDTEDENPEYFRAQVELIADTGAGIFDVFDEDRYEYVAGLVRRRIAERAAPTIESLHLGGPGSIMIYPTQLADPARRYLLYIPPTRPEHFDGGGADPENEDVLPPYGDTYVGTLTEAVELLAKVIGNAQIIANDGRVLT